MHDLSGDAFQATEVADHYVHRPPYPSQLYDCLIERALGTEGLLDLGCGEGKIARPLAKIFDRVVAVDPSASMIALGRSLEGGEAGNITWVEAKAEDAPLTGHFDLVTFASSIHWMAPEPLFAKLRPHLKPDHLLAFATGDLAHDPPWEAEWQTFLAKWVPIVTGQPLGSKAWRNSRDQHLAHVDVVENLEFISAPFCQTVDDYILCQHSRNTFALANLKGRVETFRRELREILAPHADDSGQLTFRVKTQLTLAKAIVT